MGMQRGLGKADRQWPGNVCSSTIPRGYVTFFTSVSCIWIPISICLK